MRGTVGQGLNGVVAHHSANNPRGWPHAPASGPAAPQPRLSRCFRWGRGSFHRRLLRTRAGAGPCDPRTSRDLGAAPGRSGTGERGIRISCAARLQRERWEGPPGLGTHCGLLSLSLREPLSVLRIVRPTGFPSAASLLHPPEHARSSRPEPWFSKCSF